MSFLEEQTRYEIALKMAGLSVTGFFIFLTFFVTFLNFFRIFILENGAIPNTVGNSPDP